MRGRLKNWLFQNKVNFSFKSGKYLVLAAFFFAKITFSQQIINYVTNPSFESLNSNSITSLYNTVNYWQPIDTNKFCDYLASLVPEIGNAPNALGHQYPRTGNNYIISTFFCSNCPTTNSRGYPRNRLKNHLKSNVTYCLKYYIVNTNNSPIAISNFGAYFGSSVLDTIKYCNIPLTYLAPQIQNSTGIITDTMNWVSITGTFVANGTEKYLVLGNFSSDATTNTLLINPTYSTTLANDVCIDDVSLIEYELPAYAYQSSDAWILPGDSVYLGRERDVGIDEACMWYQLPNTTTAIDTAAGIWVKPMQTTSYLVKQDICGNIKWALVTVNISDVGVNELGLIKNDFKFYPNPANNEITIAFNNEADFTKPKELKIIDVLGREVKTLTIESRTKKVNLEEINEGVYYLQLQSSNGLKITKKLVKE